MGTLAFERVAIATGRVNTTGAVNDLIHEIAGAHRPTTARRLGADPLVRQRIADLYGRALVHYLIGQRVITGAAGDGPPGPVTSIGKLFFCPLVEDIADFGLELDEMGGQFALVEKGAPGFCRNSSGGCGWRIRRAARHRGRVDIHPAQHRRRAHPRHAEEGRRGSPMGYQWNPKADEIERRSHAARRFVTMDKVGGNDGGGCCRRDGQVVAGRRRVRAVGIPHALIAALLELGAAIWRRSRTTWAWMGSAWECCCNTSGSGALSTPTSGRTRNSPGNTWPVSLSWS